MGLLLLVRHGQASFGAADYDVLSETGWEQGRVLGRHLAASGVAPTALVRGSMRRHRETLEAIADGAGWDAPASAVDERWDEFDHLGVVATWPDLPGGDTAAIDRRTFQVVFEQATARWTAGENDEDYPESYAAFRARTLAALTAAAEGCGSGATTLVVTSGGVVAAVAAALLGLDGPTYAEAWQRLNTVCVNTGVTRVLVGSRGARLLTLNEHEHVAGDLLTYR